MKCPCCEITPKIESAQNKMIDEVPYTVQTFTCRNPQCRKYEQVIGEVRHPFLGGEAEEVVYP